MKREGGGVGSIFYRKQAAPRNSPPCHDAKGASISSLIFMDSPCFQASIERFSGDKEELVILKPRKRRQIMIIVRG